MGWRLSSAVEETLTKGRDGDPPTAEEAMLLMQLAPESKETYALMESADHLSRTLFGNKGENHFHIGLSVEPCPMDCAFCSLAKRAGVFSERVDFPMDRILACARVGEAEGADAP